MSDMIEIMVNSVGGELPRRQENPIWVVSQCFYNMAESLGWDMSKFVVQVPFPKVKRKK